MMGKKLVHKLKAPSAEAKKAEGARYIEALLMPRPPEPMGSMACSQDGSSG